MTENWRCRRLVDRSWDGTQMRDLLSRSEVSLVNREANMRQEIMVCSLSHRFGVILSTRTRTCTRLPLHGCSDRCVIWTLFVLRLVLIDISVTSLVVNCTLTGASESTHPAAQGGVDCAQG